MKARGFTVVEILVVIIIMAILLTLAVVNVRSTQINARDAESFRQSRTQVAADIARAVSLGRRGM